MTLQCKTWCALGMAAGLLLVGLIPTQAGVISAGYDDSCGLQADGSLWAWGYNGDRAIVSAYTNNTKIMEESNQLGLNIPRGVYYFDDDYCWDGYSTSTPTRVGTASSWVGIYSSGLGDPNSAGWVMRTFGLQQDGSLWAWGYDGDPFVVATTNSPAALYVGKGTLGLGDKVVSETIIYTNEDLTVTTNLAHYAASAGVPTRIGTDSDWLAVAPGSQHALALKNNGSLWSWGYDGKGTFTVAVNDGTNRTRAYSRGALGLGGDLLVSTWAGTNMSTPSNEIVTNEYVSGVTTPTQIGTATDWVAAAAGLYHSLAIKSDGSLYAWGQNEWQDYVYVMTDATHYVGFYTNLPGVLGMGSVALRSTNTPTRVGTDSDWVKVAAGSICSFAIKKDGSLWAWGDNGYRWNGSNAYGYGILGLGTNVPSTNLPTRVGTDNNWSDISIPITVPSSYYRLKGLVNDNQPYPESLGYSNVHHQPCLALKSDGSLWAWGYNWINVYMAVSELPNFQSVPTRVGTDNDWVAIAAGVWHSLALKSDGSLWAWGDNDSGQLGNNNGSSFDPVQVGSLFTWGYAAPAPAIGDYDGDGTTDFVLYDAANATLLLRLSSMGWQPLLDVPIGGPGYRLVTADFDGDGVTDPATYQESTGNWQIELSRYDYNLAAFSVGGSGCAAAAADYDGDGRADPTAYKDGNGEWRICASMIDYVTILEMLGGAGSLAVPADYDHNGFAEVATYQPSTGIWQIMWPSATAQIIYGGMSYVPAVADYDGDGKADPAIYEPSTGRFRLTLSSTGYGEYDSADDGIFLGGAPCRCIPVPADYDGDGLADPAVYNYTTGLWTILLSRYGYCLWTGP